MGYTKVPKGKPKLRDKSKKKKKNSFALLRAGPINKV